MKLWRYIQKRVRIVFKDGTVLEGFVHDYIDQEDTDFDDDEIIFTPDGGRMVAVGEEEIKQIQLI
ncbi:hypothetical protein GGR02_001183 [Anoxybacillus voinovskiensis]|uniref:LSM domain-containing protein n=1 Tax=Anoxybacteroides voinovskiense TaxID=230470 RepID=A0A840DJD7_9BACL|nr:MULTISPECIES: hypothetical protein [Anoxybacillus]MBB4073421.1 hypothetical protein [Anoxybacillus voinovskiensis]MCL6587700.1 hypothetical protein [Anoxybacillus sp.]GGJ61379.1 hypothetical protein GCM10008982_08080 [Anoxybacillus voinovskiensis]